MPAHTSRVRTPIPVFVKARLASLRSRALMLRSERGDTSLCAIKEQMMAKSKSIPKAMKEIENTLPIFFSLQLSASMEEFQCTGTGSGISDQWEATMMAPAAMHNREASIVTHGKVGVGMPSNSGVPLAVVETRAAMVVSTSSNQSPAFFAAMMRWR